MVIEVSTASVGALGTKLSLIMAPEPTGDYAEVPIVFVATTVASTLEPVMRLKGAAIRVWTVTVHLVWTITVA